ncbi:hypothetical protein EHV15_36165 [Paenibacillus oralis]|uniref:Uncharacterized protein n=1 Tax=Paenibacillus oralis TaxID=2490856 RepID=A0A3P3T932_9BACL|nr:hypothetical protein [Paenibacillus oralis]RRJ53999.1 hypothetical protein EHV15_36165 [Paenibacillus oralis]
MVGSLHIAGYFFCCMLRIKTKKGADFNWFEMGSCMGGKRKDPDEVIKTISINLKQKVLDEIAKEGNPKHVIEALVNSKYSK